MNMLVVTRKLEQSVLLSGGISVKILRISGGAVRIGIEAPDHIQIVRDEIAVLDEDGSPDGRRFAGSKDAQEPAAIPRETDTKTNVTQGPIGAHLLSVAGAGE